MITKRTTVRQVLQILGDKLKEIHPMAVINSLMSDYKGRKTRIHQLTPEERDFDVDTHPNWIIPDCRFPEEIEAIKKVGGIVIRVDRPVSKRYPKIWEYYEAAVRPSAGAFRGNFYDFTKKMYPEVYKAMYHESELSLDNYKGFNGYLDNNGSLDSLRAQIEPILYKHKIQGYEYHKPK
jgi:hypothetical protein